MILDLTHTISNCTPVYPGTPAPELAAAFSLEENGFRETLLRLTSHTGTHMDAPAHLLAEGETLDALPASRFCGPAVVLDVSGMGIISKEFLQQYDRDLRSADYVLFCTGWEQKWGTEAYFAGFPVPDGDAAAYLVSCGLKGVGTDAVSVDAVGSAGLPVHRILLGGGLVIVECLRLQQLTERRHVRFYALPLKYQASDGAPVRAIAEWNDSSEAEGTI